MKGKILDYLLRKDSIWQYQNVNIVQPYVLLVKKVNSKKPNVEFGD